MAIPLVSSRRGRIVIGILLLAIAGFVAMRLQQGKPGLHAAPQLTAEQQIAKDTETAQFLVKKYGGESTNSAQHALVVKVGNALAAKMEPGIPPKTYRFHLLAELNAINSFALSNGDIYVTTAIVNRMKTEGELAAVIAHALAHAQAGHVMALPADNPDAAAPAPPAVLQFTTEEETLADRRTVKIMSEGGYSPEAFLGMFRILTDAYQAGADVPFFASHPSADGRLTAVSDAIHALYPNGIPAALSK